MDHGHAPAHARSQRSVADGVPRSRYVGVKRGTSRGPSMRYRPTLATAIACGLAVAPRASAAQDWPQFGHDVARSSALPSGSGLTRVSASSLKREQIAIDGTV